MTPLNDLVKRAAIKIHVLGAEFELNAVAKNPTKENLDKYLKKQRKINQLILDIVNGKSTS